MLASKLAAAFAEAQGRARSHWLFANRVGKRRCHTVASAAVATTGRLANFRSFLWPASPIVCAGAALRSFAAGFVHHLDAVADFAGNKTGGSFARP